MFLKIGETNEGDGPSEVVVRIDTTEGPEEVTVHSSQIQNQSVEVGLIHRKPDKGVVLVELPRETFKGKWRVWVNQKDLQPA
jgi:hypothetical protein